MTNQLTPEEYLKQQRVFYDEHVKHHPANAFCGTAGEEEMKHVQQMVSKLDDQELEQLVKGAGISFSGPGFDRDQYEDVIDEIDREDFYRLYRQIMDHRQVNT